VLLLQQILQILQSSKMTLRMENRLAGQSANHSVDETVEKLMGQAKGVTLFAGVDHSGEAAKVALKCHPLSS